MAAAGSRATLRLPLVVALGVVPLASCAFAMGIRPSLEGTGWQVRSINDEALPTTSAYQVEFRAGRLTGRFGCNSFSGPYHLGSSDILVGPLAVTEMACAQPAMAHEAAGLAALRRPLRIFWTDLGARLVLTSSAGSLDLRRTR